MSDRVRWFDRVFDLETEVSLLPNVIERLHGIGGSGLFVAEHDDHHLAGIRRAIRAGGSLR